MKQTTLEKSQCKLKYIIHIHVLLLPAALSGRFCCRLFEQERESAPETPGEKYYITDYIGYYAVEYVVHYIVHHAVCLAVCYMVCSMRYRISCSLHETVKDDMHVIPGSTL